MKNENTLRRRKCYFKLTLTFKVETTIWGSKAIFPKKPDKAANSPESRENAKLDSSCMESIIFTWFSSCRSQALLFWLRTYHGKCYQKFVYLCVVVLRVLPDTYRKRFLKRAKFGICIHHFQKWINEKNYLFSFNSKLLFGMTFSNQFSFDWKVTPTFCALFNF